MWTQNLFPSTFHARTHLSHSQLPLRVFVDRHYNKLIVLDICTLLLEIWSITIVGRVEQSCTVGYYVVFNGLYPMGVMKSERNETIFIVNGQTFRFHIECDTICIRRRDFESRAKHCLQISTTHGACERKYVAFVFFSFLPNKKTKSYFYYCSSYTSNTLLSDGQPENFGFLSNPVVTLVVDDNKVLIQLIRTTYNVFKIKFLIIIRSCYINYE